MLRRLAYRFLCMLRTVFGNDDTPSVVYLRPLRTMPLTTSGRILDILQTMPNMRRCDLEGGLVNGAVTRRDVHETLEALCRKRLIRRHRSKARSRRSARPFTQFTLAA